MTTIVAILNWNGVDHLKTYLPSVVKHSTNAKICVIDNGSTDESVTWVKETFPEVDIVLLDKNYGFAGGYNRGLKNLEADRFVLLNSDVEVSEGWIERVNSTMDKLNLSVCSPRILDYSSPTEFEYAGASGGFIDRDGFMFCRGRIFNSFESSDKYKQDIEVFWASGAALFVDSDAWRQVNGLDADFFAHMEEIDLCWRLKNRGYKVGVSGSSNVLHLGGGTLAKSSPRKVFLNFRNNLLLLLKNQKGPWLPFMLRRMVLDGIAAIRFLLRGEFSLFFAVFRAHMVFYTMIPGTLTKRSVERKAQTNSSPNTIGRYNRSIIVDYFFNKKSKFSDLDQSKFV